MVDVKQVIFSHGIKKIKNIQIFLDVFRIRQIKSDKHLVFGWGFKKTSNKARTYAKKNNIPYIALEDAFLRSYGLGVEGVSPIGLIADDLGIYYDARQPSRLELLIRDSDSLTDEQLLRAKLCISGLRQYRLTKYNVLESSIPEFEVSPKIIVVDQTVGDASIEGALASAETFTKMLNEALQNHPNETIWIKTHPDVLTGKKKGFLTNLVNNSNKQIKICAKNINPWTFFESVEHVYTVSSLMGFEALLAGCQVHCFGMPFYAGWGLTDDHITIERRNVKRSLEQLFHAAYIDYSIYVDPVVNSECQIEDVINYIQMLTQKQKNTNVKLSNFSYYRKRVLKNFFKYWNFDFSLSIENQVAVGWGRQNSGISIEDGFIRSVGLGVDLNTPISLVKDCRGIYFDATKESDLEYYLNNSELSDYEFARTQKLISHYNEHKISKYNVGNNSLPDFKTAKKKILIIGQVEGDASILYGSPVIKTNKELIKCVRDNNPDAFLIYKPHPDVVAGQRDNGKWQGDFLSLVDQVETKSSIVVLLDSIDEVHTMTSLTGFEALMRGIKVITYGMPFYAGWGLTTDFLKNERRSRCLSLEELVFNTLIRYPTYIDPISKKAITPEQAIQFISTQREGQNNSHKISKIFINILMVIRKIKKKLTYLKK